MCQSYLLLNKINLTYTTSSFTISVAQMEPTGAEFDVM